ncbi:MAG: hypothetical protein S4CHLAM45_07660 [Chlamydiales bacterium]|nr:hypothetical protein [Chlamydiales bacterium]MCH9622873.1 hypothetical protein [Chlamydiales bacterium]
MKYLLMFLGLMVCTCGCNNQVDDSYYDEDSQYRAPHGVLEDEGQAHRGHRHGRRTLLRNTRNTRH